LSVEVVEAAERGALAPAVRGVLSGLYGLNSDELMEGSATPIDESPFTTFLLHGAYQDFDADDLVVFERGIRAARIFATTAAGRAGLEQRLRFAPLRPAGPMPRDAARQGHQLARRVRASLGLGGEPLGDLRALLEERFGVAVLVDTLSTLDLRAASALDLRRGSAAAVLAADDESRLRNPTLARVYLAHELCHLLFDPAAPGRVQIALDERPHGRTSARHLGGGLALLESRAKGFAAEFLIPIVGVTALLGGPRVEPELAAARTQVARVATHFQTPWQIAVYHLKNLGFLEDELVNELVEDPSARVRSDRTVLPASGEPPLCLGALSGAVDTWRGVDVHAAQPPLFVEQSRAYVDDATSALADEVLGWAYDEAARARPVAATDLLLYHLDELLAGGEVLRVCLLLDRLDAHRLPPNVLTGVLSLTWHAREALGDVRTRLFNRCMQALEETWRVSSERREGIAERLR
jgi:Zn-dependent peptidase ImmA (M78 family)